MNETKTGKKVFITGSADGLGHLTAKLLVSQGHQVVLHARNAERGRDALSKVPGAEKVLIADLSRMEETKQLADEVNTIGPFDAVIHNAGIYKASNELIFAVNTLAPYVLTCLIQKPKRIIYLSSGMHMHGKSNLKNLTLNTNYSDSKLHVLMLMMIAARKWPDVYSNGVDPGWVPTKMGGRGAPDNLEKGFETQVWLAVSSDDKVKVTGRYFYHQKQKHFLPEAADINLQEEFLVRCEQLSGVRFPSGKMR